MNLWFRRTLQHGYIGLRCGNYKNQGEIWIVCVLNLYWRISMALWCLRKKCRSKTNTKSAKLQYICKFGHGCQKYQVRSVLGLFFYFLLFWFVLNLCLSEPVRCHKGNYIPVVLNQMGCNLCWLPWELLGNELQTAAATMKTVHISCWESASLLWRLSGWYLMTLVEVNPISSLKHSIGISYSSVCLLTSLRPWWQG